jgi:hypothetical protein
MKRRPAALLIPFEGESVRGGGGREGEERTCPCTKCTHMHVVFPPSLFPISPFCCRSLSQYEKVPQERYTAGDNVTIVTMLQGIMEVLV